MQTNRLQNNFFFAILIGVIVLTFFIFLPYLSPLIIAAVFAVLFRPMHRRIVDRLGSQKENSSVAALVTLLTIVLLVLTPLFFITAQLSVEIFLKRVVVLRYLML
jgi:predicted PurR-regulated permease PerM